MNAGPKILDLTSDVRPAGPSRKPSAVDLGGFAFFLNANEDRLGRLSGSTAPSRTAAGGDSSLRTEKAEAPRSGSDTGKSTERNPHTDDDTADTDRRSPAQASDSGQSRRASSESVDGRETDVQPGASTEAAANAQSSESAAAAESAASDVPVAEAIQKLVDQSVDSAPAGTGAEKPSATMEITARNTDRHNQVFPPNLGLPDGGTVFGTGLAEHFIRLLTDQFSGLQTDSAASSDVAVPGAVSAGTSGGPAGNAEAKANAQAATPTLHLADEASETTNRILQIVRANVGRRQSQMTVQLDPPELGKMKLDVRLQDNTLRLFVTTETDSARQILLDRMDTLRHSLEQSGITMAKFEVVTKTPESQSSQNWQFPQGNSQGNAGFFQQQRGSASPSKEERSDSVSIASTDAEPTPIAGPSAQSPPRALNLVA